MHRANVPVRKATGIFVDLSRPGHKVRLAGKIIHYFPVPVYNFLCCPSCDLAPLLIDFVYLCEYRLHCNYLLLNQKDARRDCMGVEIPYIPRALGIPRPSFSNPQIAIAKSLLRIETEMGCPSRPVSRESEPTGETGPWAFGVCCLRYSPNNPQLGAKAIPRDPNFPVTTEDGRKSFTMPCSGQFSNYDSRLRS